MRIPIANLIKMNKIGELREFGGLYKDFERESAEIKHGFTPKKRGLFRGFFNKKSSYFRALLMLEYGQKNLLILYVKMGVISMVSGCHASGGVTGISPGTWGT